MTPAATISLIGLAITLAVILVQLGRVLQRADHVEKELKTQGDAAEVVRKRTHDLANALQTEASKRELAELRLAHAEQAAASVRVAHDSGLGDVHRVLNEMMSRLIHIESALAHQSPPPPVPGGGGHHLTPAHGGPAPQFPPPRRPTGG